MNYHSNIVGGYGWTDERIAFLKRRWADGLSASQIAVELGGVTRNAVLGKLDRLGASERDKGWKRTGNGATKPRAKYGTYSDGQRARRARERAEAGRPMTKAERDADFPRRQAEAERRRLELADERAPDLTPEQRAHAKTLMQLTAVTCRWPLGDPASPDFLFCGDWCDPEVPYCRAHMRMAYQPRREAAA